MQRRLYTRESATRTTIRQTSRYYVSLRSFDVYIYIERGSVLNGNRPYLSALIKSTNFT